MPFLIYCARLSQTAFLSFLQRDSRDFLLGGEWVGWKSSCFLIVQTVVLSLWGFSSFPSSRETRKFCEREEKSGNQQTIKNESQDGGEWTLYWNWSGGGGERCIYRVALENRTWSRLRVNKTSPDKLFFAISWIVLRQLFITCLPVPQNISQSFFNFS